VLKGEGEDNTKIIQNDSTHNLFILINSRLNTKYLTAELCNSNKALVRA
jgi:hypothetical protein